MVIAKKKGWHRFSMPFGPAAPFKPQPELPQNPVTVYTENSSCETRFNLSDVDLPPNVKLEDCYVDFYVDTGYDNDVTSTVRVMYVPREKLPNPKYEELLTRYKEQHAAYLIEYRKHKEEVKQWKNWCQQEDRSDEESRVKAAEALLRKHGRL